MNRVNATVTAIEETGVVTYVLVECGGTEMRIIKAHTPEWLGVGDNIRCTIQEASVCVSKACPGKVSIENRIPATLKAVRKNASLCELTFESALGSVVSLITAHAYDNLTLEKNCRATMLLRGVDIGIEPLVIPMNGDMALERNMQKECK